MPTARTKATLTAKQARGKNMACSQQIFEEALWGVNYTCNAGWTASRVADLAVSLLDDDQAWAAEQQQEGGFWGPCYKTWFNRVAMLIDSVGQLQSKLVDARLQRADSRLRVDELGLGRTASLLRSRDARRGLGQKLGHPLVDLQQDLTGVGVDEVRPRVAHRRPVRQGVTALERRQNRQVRTAVSHERGAR